MYVLIVLYIVFEPAFRERTCYEISSERRNREGGPSNFNTITTKTRWVEVNWQKHQEELPSAKSTES